MKLRLDNDDLENDFFENARLLGIVAPLKGYQLCWQLNNQLRYDFRLNNQIEIQLAKKQRKYFFCVYQCCQSNSTLVHYLYNNHFDGEYLLPEFRHLDFLWLLKGDIVQDEMLAELVITIKKINGIQLVTELTNEKIRHKGHLIF
ncbi:MAG TPA: IPExxxVDY family protein [Puia sp.]|nr:IPExxxVDY family protein [Puia sp.]